jgi:aminopeptidase N
MKCLADRTLLCALALALAVAVPPARGQDSGGRLPEAQRAVDVTYYGLDLRVDPDAEAIEGVLTAHARAERPTRHLVLNLDRRLRVRRAWPAGTEGRSLAVERRADSNEVWIDLERPARPGDTLRVALAYGGRPREAPQPPWDGGFTWAQTPAGEPWIATSCQTGGADLWWPVKDHPGDEPDSMNVAVTVPGDLVAASNGRLRRKTAPEEGQTTYHWHVSTPINPYAVAINVAPYARIDTAFASTSGRTVPAAFYALPADSARARSHFGAFLDHVGFLEETLGPYPFGADKYGIAQAPFLGMEHQTLIAYGNDFGENGDGLGYAAGFDALHFHEAAHEWYGNCVTAADWKDFWLHEGTATYLEALYAESLRGDSAYHAVTDHFRRQVAGGTAIARRTPTSAQSIYGRDVYFKGAAVLHTLRYVIGEEAVRRLLREFANPSGTLPGAPQRRCRHATTAEFVETAEAVADRELDAFFMAYLYRADLPALETTRSDGRLRLAWKGVGDVPFAVPVPVRVDGRIRRVDMTGGTGAVDLAPGADVTVDPRGWILRAEEEGGGRR